MSQERPGDRMWVKLAHHKIGMRVPLGEDNEDTLISKPNAEIVV